MDLSIGPHYLVFSLVVLDDATEFINVGDAVDTYYEPRMEILPIEARLQLESVLRAMNLCLCPFCVSCYELCFQDCVGSSDTIITQTYLGQPLKITSESTKYGAVVLDKLKKWKYSIGRTTILSHFLDNP